METERIFFTKTFVALDKDPSRTKRTPHPAKSRLPASLRVLHLALESWDTVTALADELRAQKAEAS
jgi:hypothetical protein